ncbi:ribosome small subunit-dependent GTPase A [Deinococcus sp. HMF7604]|uniref:ribosome small subunit-dependent GTPase A n=1 Tax=Deinococcus betulae TaxID=2873312 RepID=UPI001CC94FF9|nr:ribosome small subunit-dependent GTPase A [Deinococcus betulae]MBZ9752345.1 ribosome small subunit-dependent GTPase A [Deinococcus betulae]
MLPELRALGWGADFESDYQAFCRTLTPEAQPQVQPVRVVGTGRQIVHVRGAHGDTEARLAGTLRQEQVAPAIGDWAVLEGADGGPGRLLQVLPRRTTFSRAVGADEGRRPQAVRQQVIAANVDVVLIVTAPDADFDLDRLERYVQAVQASGAQPVLVLNKADLRPDVGWYLDELQSLGAELEVHAVSAADGQGLDALQALLTEGVTLALIGSSGVGKSTLTNALLRREAAQTGAVRASDSQGRHTTTTRTLYLVPGGGLLIDNPGLRDIAVWDAAAADFDDLEDLAAQCRFRKCTHTTEPGCAVQAAVQAGEVSAARLAAFQAQQRQRR